MAAFDPHPLDPDVSLNILQHADQIDAAEWNGLLGCDYPFLQHSFLTSMEQSGCTAQDTGWTPHHLLLCYQEQPIAALPTFIKTHSYGEFVFDWAWADAYRRYGFNYYPKLVCAAPFTPASGPRMLCAKDSPLSPNDIAERLQSQMELRCHEQAWSSIHLNFPSQDESALWDQLGWHQRLGVQYHWFNRGYRDFEDYLDRFASRKRKNLRKERQKVFDQGLSLRRLEGTQITSELMDTFYRFYHLTYLKRSGRHGYLNREFFHLIQQRMADQIMMVLAYQGEDLVAAALNFKDQHTLYGRYWGCYREYDFLHFETCYYQGIEYCIEQGLQRFDPGAQGEHKIQRGFEPVATWSNHWIREPAFRDAIKAFLIQERAQIEAYIEQARTGLPFKESAKLTRA